MSEIMGGAMCAGRIVSGACLDGKRIGLAHAGQLICPSGKNRLAYPLGVRTDGLMRCELMRDGGLQVTLKAGLKQWNGLGVTVTLADIGLSPGDTVTLSSRYGDVVPQNCSFNIKFRAGGGEVVYDSGVWGANGQLAVTIPDAATRASFTVFRGIATTEDCEMILHPMLEKGSTRTVWEPPGNAGGQGLDATSPALNLIVNGGFETGDLTGWTVSKNSVFRVLSSDSSLAQYITSAHSGRYWILCNKQNSTISQHVEVTPGSVMRLSLWRAEAGSSRDGVATVTADDGRTITTMPLPGQQHKDWIEWTCDFDVPADVMGVTVNITSFYWMRLDDVSLIRIG